MFKTVSMIVALVAVLCVVPTLINSSPIGNSCKHLEREPDYASIEASNIKSSDNKALVNLVGALHIYKPNVVGYFTQLNLTSVEWSQEGEKKQELTLKDACAEFKFTTQKSRDGKVWELVKMEATLENDGNGPLTCSSNFIQEYPIGQHPKINMGRNYLYVLTCNLDKASKLNLSLKLQNFEFELNGNPDKIEKGEFSTKVHSMFH